MCIDRRFSVNTFPKRVIVNYINSKLSLKPWLPREYSMELTINYQAMSLGVSVAAYIYYYQISQGTGLFHLSWSFLKLSNFNIRSCSESWGGIENGKD